MFERQRVLTPAQSHEVMADRVERAWVCTGRSLHSRHPCAGMHGKGDDGDLPKIDVLQPPQPGARVSDRFLGTEANREAIDAAGAHQRQHFARPRHGEVELSAHLQAARIFRDRQPRSDRFCGVMLPQHLDAARAAFAQRLRERALCDHIAAKIGGVEQARIAFEHAGRRHVGQRQRRAFGLTPVMPGGGCFVHRNPLWLS